MPYLFAEERHGDRQATEAVLLTFTADLAFFEARVLGLCQAAGARVTIAADAGVWQPDARGTRGAGRAYHLGLLATGAAFHPKVLVLVGPKRAVVAIGSANLTLSGWQSNDEMWTVFTGDTTEVPAAFTAVVDLLSDLEAVSDPLTRSGLRRTAAELRALISQSQLVDTGHQIVTSFRQPILTQLPRGPVDEVRMHAPFHDRDCAGVAAVLGRLQPRSATVMVQPGATVIEPQALRAALDRSGVSWEVVADAEHAPGSGKYRHGKLIEWTTRGERWALTGSPNLSRSALLHPASSGNHEVAVLCGLDESLFPPSAPVDFGDIPSVSIHPADGSRGRHSVPVLLAAFRVADGLQLALSAPLAEPAMLQFSAQADVPEDWTDGATVPVGDREPVLRGVDIPAASRVRLGISTAQGSVLGMLVYVSDPARVQSRPAMSRLSKARKSPVPDFWGEDIELLHALADDLSQLASDVATTRAPGAASSGADGGADAAEVSPRRDTDTTPWLWIHDQAVSSHGSHLAAFGLGLPSPPSADSSAPGWVDLLTDDKTAALESDTAEDTAIETDDTTPEDDGPEHSSDREDRKRARRRWSAEWSEKADTVPLTSGLIVLRLVLVFWGAGNWKESDRQPHQVVDRLLRQLTCGAIPADLESRLGSLTAVALAMMRDRTDLTSGNEGALTYIRLRDDLGYLTLAATTDLTTEYTRFLRTPSRAAMHPAHVLSHLRTLREEDPLNDTIVNLEENDYRVERTGSRLILVRGDFDNPELVALEAVAYAERHSPFGVWAVSDDGDWTFMSWNKPDLIRATSVNGAPVRWLHQRFTGLVGPAARYASRFRNHGPQRVIRHGRPTQIFPEAVEALSRLGLAGPEPPALHGP